MKKPDITIREASQLDLPKIHALLSQAQLLADDLLVAGTRYWLAEDAAGRPVGMIGLESGSSAALLRSVAVSPSLRGQGLGTFLVQYVLDVATAAGHQHIYLFSTDAGAYWRRLHFYQVPVSELVSALPAAPQVKHYQALGWLPTEIAWRCDLK